MNTDFTLTFNTALTLCVVAALNMNPLLSFYCTTIIIIRLTFLNGIAEIIGKNFNITAIPPKYHRKYTEIDNSHLVNATIKYLLDSGRFHGPFFNLQNILRFDYIYG